jgi:tetratricopeptide (TPR) repeat protein
MKTLSLIILAVCSMNILAGCSNPSGTAEDARSLTNKGWAFFVNGEYGEAQTKFEGAIMMDSTYAEAYNGLGWAYAMQDLLDLARTNLERANKRDLSGPDAYAGLAPVYRDLRQPEFRLAIAAADTVLSEDPDYEFEYYPQYDYHDLYLIQAQCYYYLGVYDTSAFKVAKMTDSDTLDLYSPEFVKVLAESIESLGREYSGGERGL